MYEFKRQRGFRGFGQDDAMAQAVTQAAMDAMATETAVDIATTTWEQNFQQSTIDAALQAASSPTPPPPPPGGGAGTLFVVGAAVLLLFVAMK